MYVYVRVRICLVRAHMIMRACMYTYARVCVCVLWQVLRHRLSQVGDSGADEATKGDVSAFYYTITNLQTTWIAGKACLPEMFFFSPIANIRTHTDLSYNHYRSPRQEVQGRLNVG